MKKILLSVVINTKNAGKTLARTLKSVQFADEVVVVDSQSTDDTVAIAKKYTSLIFHFTKKVNFVEPVRNFAISKARGEWILIVDADEEIPSSLSKVLKKIIKINQEGGDTADCYYLPRKNVIFNKWIKYAGWWPDMQLRFFKKGTVKWDDKIHSIPLTKGKTKELSILKDNAIIHYNYQHLIQFVSRMNNYTTIQALELDSKTEEVSSSMIFKRFSSEFFTRLFLHQGVKDGVHGLSLSLLQGMSEALVMMKVWENQGFKEDAKENELIQQLEVFDKELNYWLASWHIDNSNGLKRWWWKIKRKIS